MSATAKLINTILNYTDDHSPMLHRFKKLAEEAANETPRPVVRDPRDLWDLQRKL